MSTLFRKSSILNIGEQKKPDVATIVEVELPGLKHLAEMTKRFPSAAIANEILETCISKVEQVVHGATNQLEAETSFSMNR